MLTLFAEVYIEKNPEKVLGSPIRGWPVSGASLIYLFET